MKLSSYTDEILLKSLDLVFDHWPRSTPDPEQIKKVQLVAHRGHWNRGDRIENTMNAFMPLLKSEIEAVEFDVRWTRDHQAIVHHDSDLKRLFGLEQKIEDLTLEKLKEICPLIPTLTEVLNQLGKKKHLFIEIKTPLTHLQKIQFQSDLKFFTPKKDFHIMSLSLKALSELELFQSKALVSVARMNMTEVFNKTIEMNWGGLTGHYLLLTSTMIGQCHEREIQVGTGFPQSQNCFYREVHRGVDWVFSNKAMDLASLQRTSASKA